jgi:hypothetical protein
MSCSILSEAPGSLGLWNDEDAEVRIMRISISGRENRRLIAAVRSPTQSGVTIDI